MKERGMLLALMLGGLVSCTGAQAGPGLKRCAADTSDANADSSASPASANFGTPYGSPQGASGARMPRYPRLHYWAPTIYRVRAHWAPDISQYLSDLYPFVPPTVQILRYRTPAVDPACLYLNSGLPYDPARPIVSPPPTPAKSPY